MSSEGNVQQPIVVKRKGLKGPLNSSVSTLPVGEAKALWTYAIVRETPNSFSTNSIQDFYLASHEPASVVPIDLSLAKKQHQRYCSILANYVSNLVKVEADEELPDCIFIEDTTVIIGTTAVITRPGHPNRLRETEEVRKTLAKIKIITELRDMQPPATCDGGDVLWTGRHLFVGLSHRTNQEGADFLREVFEPKGIQVITLKVEGASLHLKTIITSADEQTLIAVDTEACDKVLDQIKERAGLNGYTTVKIPPSEGVGANVLRLDNTTLLIQGGTGFSSLQKVLRDAMPTKKLVTVEMSEFIKADGGLTCSSLLF